VDIPELIQHPAVLAELSYALSPVLHEGKLQPYFMAIKKSNASVLKSTCEKLLINLPEARRVADGCHGFSIFKRGSFMACSFPSTPPIHCWFNFSRVECHHLHDHTSGVTKLFAMLDCLFTNISWQKKPCALQNICRCAPQADSETLKNLLEFCFHDLSPRKIGATLVWCLTEPSAEEWENPNFTLQEIETRVGSRSVAVLRHLLTYTDGAVILDAQARAIGVGAQLKYSEASKRLMRHVPEPDIPQLNDSPTILPKELYLSFRAMVRSLFSPTA